MTARDEELETVLAIARDAAKIVMAVYATPFSVELKGPDDPVTRADREANDLICARLAEAFPSDGILAEESAPATDDEASAIANKPRVWFVDPLDGTKEFALRNDEFAVMIGLAVSGRASMGVVVLPTTGEALAGRVGHGAFLETKDGARAPLDASTANESITLVHSRSHRAPLVDAIAARLGVTKRFPCGSVGVKVARVATHAADVYIHTGLGAKLWDVCAPEAILDAAGGKFTELMGAPVDYARGDLFLKGGILAARASVYERAKEACRAAIL